MVKMIFDTLGKPNEHELSMFIKNHNALEFVSQLPDKEPQSIKNVLNYSNPLALDLLDKMLQINPHRRITAKDALNHEYFKTIREHDDDKAFKGDLDFNFE